MKPGMGENRAAGRCRVVHLGRYGYREAWALQERLVELRAGALVPDTLLLLSHPPVITIGRQGTRANILVDGEVLARAGIEIHETDRGGDVTYHGPGQLVAYAVLDLGWHGRDLHRLIFNYEEVVIRVLHRYGVKGCRLEKHPGVWVEGRKIGAVGVAVRNWVCYHGFAVNIDPDMTHFSYILPCGIRESGVTSLARVSGRPVAEAGVAQVVAEVFGEVFGREMVTGYAPEELWAGVRFEP